MCLVHRFSVHSAKLTPKYLLFFDVTAVSSGCVVLEQRAAERRYPTSKVRSSGCEEIHPMSKVRETPVRRQALERL